MRKNKQLRWKKGELEIISRIMQECGGGVRKVEQPNSDHNINASFGVI
jgi:hypothetical protein